MQESELIERLVLFALSRQEALIYIRLFEKKELTGYEAAKVTGISRSNAYTALAGLAEKGAAYVMEGNPSRYIPVPIKDFCENKIRLLQRKKDFLEDNMPKTSPDFEGYITIVGYRHILDKVHHMIEETKQRLYLAADIEVISLLWDSLKKAIEDEHKVVLITNKAITNLPLQCYVGEKMEGQIRLITDSAYVLTGELTGSPNDSCLFSGQKNFVEVFKEALRNKIKLIEMEEKENGN